MRSRASTRTRSRRSRAADGPCAAGRPDTTISAASAPLHAVEPEPTRAEAALFELLAYRHARGEPADVLDVPLGLAAFAHIEEDVTGGKNMRFHTGREAERTSSTSRPIWSTSAFSSGNAASSRRN